jgi:2-dehydro-3-deoxygalactonokinase
MNKAWIGIDWGSTHRRAWRYDDGALTGRHQDEHGAVACAGRFAEWLPSLFFALDADATDSTVVMAGMVGSALGWQEVPYLDADEPLMALPQRLARVTREGAPPDAWIVPGLRWRGAGKEVDVMRGEETQLLGALRLLGTSADGWYLLPGTHSKWVWLQGGRLRWMRTYLSGELYALLSKQGTLAPLMPGEPTTLPPDAESFAEGVAAAKDGALSHALFGLRAKVVTGDLPREVAPGYLSGLLMGSEWHDVMRSPGVQGPVRVIGAPVLSELHGACARQLGLDVEPLDAEAVQQASWQALREGMAA